MATKKNINLEKKEQDKTQIVQNINSLTSNTSIEIMNLKSGSHKQAMDELYNTVVEDSVEDSKKPLGRPKKETSTNVEKALGNSKKEASTNVEKALGNSKKEASTNVEKALGNSKKEVATEVVKKALGNSKKEVATEVVKKALGRPKKEASTKVKKALGNSKKEVATEVVKKALGRPKKEASTKVKKALGNSKKEVATEVVKKALGRPKKEASTKVKKALGRPKKGTSTSTKKALGRPKKEKLSSVINNLDSPKKVVVGSTEGTSDANNQVYKFYLEIESAKLAEFSSTAMVNSSLAEEKKTRGKEKNTVLLKLKVTEKLLNIALTKFENARKKTNDLRKKYLLTNKASNQKSYLLWRKKAGDLRGKIINLRNSLREDKKELRIVSGQNDFLLSKEKIYQQSLSGKQQIIELMQNRFAAHMQKMNAKKQKEFLLETQSKLKKLKRTEAKKINALQIKNKLLMLKIDSK